MTDLGAPTSYLAVAAGTPVLSADGSRVGTVAHVLAVEEQDVFDGLVIDTDDGARFVDATQVDGLYARGAVLTLDAAAAERLAAPRENPAQVGATPDDTVDDTLGDKLRRAWDLVSGKG
ncbi:PRC-barrel domain-containing protein [Patulibacter sp. S7RM1-6]